MIKSIKIFGERNSGTNFLEQLLNKNLNNIHFHSFYYKGGTGWKHGFPKIRLFKNTDETLFIFIVRDLYPWLKSMYNNPYHYKRPENINIFLTNKPIFNDPRLDHDTHVYEEENEEVLTLRYNKLNSYLHFFSKVENAIMVNLEDLQNNNEKFLSFISNEYNLSIDKPYKHVANHTKLNVSIKNREYDINLPMGIVNEKRNDKDIRGCNKK